MGIVLLWATWALEYTAISVNIDGRHFKRAGGK